MGRRVGPPPERLFGRDRLGVVDGAARPHLDEKDVERMPPRRPRLSSAARERVCSPGVVRHRQVIERVVDCVIFGGKIDVVIAWSLACGFDWIVAGETAGTESAAVRQHKSPSRARGAHGTGHAQPVRNCLADVRRDDCANARDLVVDAHDGRAMVPQ